MQFGPDGHIYIAPISGGQISAIDANTGVIEAIRRYTATSWQRTMSRLW